uniref:DUF1574 domain-containing protein n=1 Tax=Parastrongyloides trichosuri TaxID=131310 RepID=A0A0N5A1B1_PARTI
MNLFNHIRTLTTRVQSPKTTILLIHNGQPKSLYYAKNFLTSQLNENQNIPSFISKSLIDNTLKYNQNVLQCMTDYTNSIDMTEYLSNITKELQNKLTQTSPYGAPYKIDYSFSVPISDIDYSIESKLMNILTKDGTQRFIVFPLHPVYDKKTNDFFKNKVNKFLEEHTEIIDYENTNFRVAKNYPVSFDYSFINEWFRESFIQKYWIKRLENLFNESENKPDMILFTIPNINIPGNEKDVESFKENYKSICSNIIRELGFPSPFRVTYYDQWFSMIPTLFSKDNLVSTIKEHKKKGKEFIVIVPLLDLIPSFDTITTLPRIASNKNVKYLSPSGTTNILIENFRNIIEKELLE